MMRRRQPFGIWVKNHVANPVMRPLLRSRAGHRLGQHLALIRYRGPRTGRVYEFPVQYARVGNHLWILPGSPEHKTWWHHMRDGAAVDLVLAGHAVHGKATALTGAEHPDEVAEGLVAYVRAMPRAARSLGLSTGRTSRDADVRLISRSIVLVRVDLDERATPAG
jgi:F420H(2)-dependent quinone reductase